MFHENRIADHELGQHEAGDLGIGEVPGHDAQQHAQRLVEHVGGDAIAGIQRGGFQVARGVIGEPVGVLADGGELGGAIAQRFAHFPPDNIGELSRAFRDELPEAVQDSGAGGHRGIPPAGEDIPGSADHAGDRGGGQGGEAFFHLAGIGVMHAVVSHESSLLCCGPLCRANPAIMGTLVLN